MHQNEGLSEQAHLLAVLLHDNSAMYTLFNYLFIKISSVCV